MTPLDAVREVVAQEIASLDMHTAMLRRELEDEQAKLAKHEDRAAELARRAVEIQQCKGRLTRFTEEGADDGHGL